MYPEVILKVRSREGASVREEGAGGPCPPWGSPFRCPIVGWAGGGGPKRGVEYILESQGVLGRWGVVLFIYHYRSISVF